MAILDFNSMPPRNSGRSNAGQQQDDLPKSQLWLNVGYEANGKFINLPLGMAIDTMRPADTRGQNEDFVKQQSARNDLLKALQQLGASFEPGQEQEINLVVKLRRVNAELT